jgi:hypothetical protein
LKKNVNRHGSNRFKTYREIHETVIGQFVSRDFIKTTTLKFDPCPEGIILSGEIACLGNIVIGVDKLLDILSGSGDNAIVETCWYSYNAFVRGYGNILRYDNQHDEFLRPGHLDGHHKHVFDWKTREEYLGSPYWVGRQDWPTLGQALQEIQNWYYQNYSILPDPDAYPSLNLREAPPSLEL